MNKITTVRELRNAIREANDVLIQARFGVSERWLKITKREAMTLFDDLTYGDEDATPDGFEMFTGTFGELRDGTLYLG